MNIYDLDHSDLLNILTSWGEPAFRADQVWQSLYQQFSDSPDQFTVLPITLRKKLNNHFGRKNLDEQYTLSHLKVKTHLISTDQNTQKTLSILPDGNAIETVLMRYNRRRTICVSTQSGCAMGCTFCATGQMGFFRSLSSGEIVEQVVYFARNLASRGENLTNVVLMGMGEPFHNYDATLSAIDRMNHPQGLNIGARRFTVSTVGLVPTIKQFAAEKRQINLAVSLHAAEDTLRSSMLPINRKYPLDVLLPACLDYVKQTKRRITFEWALIDNINDTPQQAQALAQRLQSFKIGGSVYCHVNAIPLNPTNHFTGNATERERANVFKSELESRGIPCTIRIRRGIDIQAGCGQLAADKARSPKP